MCADMLIGRSHGQTLHTSCICCTTVKPRVSKELMWLHQLVTAGSASFRFSDTSCGRYFSCLVVQCCIIIQDGMFDASALASASVRVS